MKNTFKKGVSRVLIFEDKNEKVWYGVALDFNLVVDGNDPEEVRFNLRNLMVEFVESARLLGDENLLNQKTEKEYEEMWSSLEKENQSIKSPYQIYSMSKEYVQ